jgi:SAM-dependent methyltransferase
VEVSPSTRDPRLIRYQARQHGLKSVLTKRYLRDARCYRPGHELQRAYEAFADLLFAWSDCASACDLGCGPGLVLQALAHKGVDVLGFDGSPAAVSWASPSIRSKVQIRDLAVPQHLGVFDLAISTEVAEHLPKRVSKTFVENIARAARHKIAFSAAHPGQWGDGHINCRPPGFWIALFEREGWQFDPKATSWIRGELGRSEDARKAAPWLLENLLLFERVPLATVQ